MSLVLVTEDLVRRTGLGGETCRGHLALLFLLHHRIVVVVLASQAFTTEIHSLCKKRVEVVMPGEVLAVAVVVGIGLSAVFEAKHLENKS